MKSEEGMAAVLNRMIAGGSSRHRHEVHAEVIEWPRSEEEEAQQEEDQADLQKGEISVDGADIRAIRPRYSLKYGLLRRSPSSNSTRDEISSSSSGQRRKLQQMFTSASSNSPCSSSLSPSASSQTWDERSAQWSDRIKCLLSELASSISSAKAAFGLLRASARPLPSAQDAYSRAREVMAEELQTLSDVQMRLYSLIQRHDLGMKADYASDTSISMPTTPEHSVQRHATQLKSYEGIITRFHEELRKKDAVIEALKETLAKSILKVEKLERRIKKSEAKLSSLT